MNLKEAIQAKFISWYGNLKAGVVAESNKEDLANLAFNEGVKIGMQEAINALKEREGKAPSTCENEAELESCINDIKYTLDELQ